MIQRGKLTKKNLKVSQMISDQKSKKYDRQLRLWGAHGQQSLESAKVLLLGADACGTELLKNLVLPGKKKAVKIPLNIPGKNHAENQ